MAANARALGYCFNPISVFWCHRRGGELAGVVVEVHNTYGDRHAYLVHPDEQGRARTDEADVRLAVPRHRRPLRDRRPAAGPERLHVTVTLHSDDGAVFSASLDGDADLDLTAAQCPRRPARRPAHPRPRHLAVGPPPRDPPTTHAPTTGRRLNDDHALPPGHRVARPRHRPHRPQGRRLRPHRPPAVPRRRTPPAGDRPRRESTVHGLGGPSMVLHRPDEFFARIGRDGLIGFGESYMTGAWEAEDLGGFLTVLAAELPTLIPRAAAEAARGLRAPAPAGAPEHGGQRPRQHRAPLRPVQRPLPAVPRRDAELLLGALRHLDRGPRRPPRGRTAGGSRPRAARRGPGAQDRAAARPDRCRRGHPRPRDRHRLGRARDPRCSPRRDRPLGDLVERAARARRAAHRRGRARRPRDGRACDYRAVAGRSTTPSSPSR